MRNPSFIHLSFMFVVNSNTLILLFNIVFNIEQNSISIAREISDCSTGTVVPWYMVCVCSFVLKKPILATILLFSNRVLHEEEEEIIRYRDDNISCMYGVIRLL